jgi:RNA polymerase sigma-70 factor, ECF subfamily
MTVETPGVADGSGSQESFESFFAREHARLQRALFVLVGNTGEAEDLAQEALVRVWERWGRVSTMEDPVGYLYRTAMNQFKSHRRRAIRGARRMLAHRTAPDPLAAADDRDMVGRALRRLTERQRMALVLTEFLELDSSEAGRAMGVSPSTVRNLHAQARTALRAQLEDTWIL